MSLYWIVVVANVAAVGTQVPLWIIASELAKDRSLT
jgi:hypothetical protein